METLASLCKRRGFIFQGSEIYGGLNGFWDYGPLGTELKRAIRECWWRDVVRRRDDVVGLDAAIIMPPRVWEASGHLEGFTDPMVDCRLCKRRYRADQLFAMAPPVARKELPILAFHEGAEEGLPRRLKHLAGKDADLYQKVAFDAVGEGDYGRLIGPDVDEPGSLTPPRAFNLMFKTHVGPVADASSEAYLRPETAQAIFAQFANVLAVARQKVPFGIAQIGKAFRNEINPRNYTFRSREFEQMELEFFIVPGTDAEWHARWVQERLDWYGAIGLPAERLHLDVHPPEKLAHYATACTDIAYAFPFGIQELEGIAARGDYDLRRHQEYSGKSLEYFDAALGHSYLPHVIEPSAGVDRIALALLCEAYSQEWVPAKGISGGVRPAEGATPPEGYETRTVMRFAPCVAPVKVAVFPLLKNKPELVNKARELYETLRERWPVAWDVTGAIGRRYRRQDEIGTPYAVTVDFDTLADGTVTLRDRDSMQQERMAGADLPAFLEERLH